MWGGYIESVVLVLQFPHWGSINYQNKPQCRLDIRHRSHHLWFFSWGTQPGQPWLPQGEVSHAYQEHCKYTLKQEAHISDKSRVCIWSELTPVMNQHHWRNGENTRNPSWLPTGASSPPFPLAASTEKLGCAMNSLLLNFLPQKMTYSCWFFLRKL